MDNKKTTETKDRRIIFSTLWIFVMFNYLYLDLAMMIFQPEVYQRVATKMNDGIILGAAIVMEILIAMILLSRILKYRANRWANIIGGIVGTAFVALTLLSGKPAPFYLFISIIEIACTLFIIWYAWTWPNPNEQHIE